MESPAEYWVPWLMLCFANLATFWPQYCAVLRTYFKMLLKRSVGEHGSSQGQNFVSRYNEGSVQIWDSGQTSPPSPASTVLKQADLLYEPNASRLSLFLFWCQYNTIILYIYMVRLLASGPEV